MKLLGNAKPDKAAVKQMKNSEYNYPTTRWAAYQNNEIGNPNLGHLKFIAVGPDNTFKSVFKGTLPDMLGQINWRYQFVGFVNLKTGLIEEGGEEDGKGFDDQLQHQHGFQ